MWDTIVNEHIPQEIIERKNDSELAIYYKNGVIQRFIGSQDHDKHRGTNPFDVVLDEFSEQNPEIWTAIFQPVLMENGGTATFVFTPKGKNHSWEILKKAEANALWFTSVKGVKDTQVFTEEALQEIRANTPQSLYEQEYEVAFLDGAGQFFRRIRHNTYNHEAVVLKESGDFQLGVDLAKYQDWTVLTPFNLNTFIVYPQERFNQVDWNLQKAKIEAMARRYSDALIVPDSTGLGDPIVEDLRQRGLRIANDGAGFKFTETSRRQLLDNLAILLEQDKIRIPNDEGLLTELESFRFEMSDQGRIKVTVPQGMHDDRVMSLALAVYGVKNPIVDDMYSMTRISEARKVPGIFK